MAFYYFCCQGNNGPIEQVGKCFLFFYGLGRIGNNSLLNVKCLIEFRSEGKPSGPGLFFVGIVFFITNLISSLVIGLSILSISSNILSSLFFWYSHYTYVGVLKWCLTLFWDRVYFLPILFSLFFTFISYIDVPQVH